MKGKRNECLNGPGLVRQCAHAQHVIHALGDRFDMAVEHRDVGPHPEAVRRTVDVEVTIRSALVVANLSADAFGKDLCTPAWQ